MTKPNIEITINGIDDEKDRAEIRQQLTDNDLREEIIEFSETEEQEVTA